MTAPGKPLPRCPVCGRKPERGGKPRYCYVDCPNKTATHIVSVSGKT